MKRERFEMEKKMKQYFICMLAAILFSAISLPARAAAAGSFDIDGEGTVTVTSGQAAQDGASTFQFCLYVDSPNASSVEFRFRENGAKVQEFRYDPDEKKLNIYVAGTEALFAGESNSLTVGQIVILDGSGNAAAASVSVEENSFQYVYGTELKQGEDMQLPGTVQIGTRDSVSNPPLDEGSTPGSNPSLDGGSTSGSSTSQGGTSGSSTSQGSTSGSNPAQSGDSVSGNKPSQRNSSSRGTNPVRGNSNDGSQGNDGTENGGLDGENDESQEKPPQTEDGAESPGQITDMPDGGEQDDVRSKEGSDRMFVLVIVILAVIAGVAAAAAAVIVLKKKK